MKNTILILCLSLMFIMPLTACQKSSDKYEATLNSGLSKYASGESMTKEEYKAVKGYKEWEAKQGTQTYNQWDNQ